MGGAHDLEAALAAVAAALEAGDPVSAADASDRVTAACAALAAGGARLAPEVLARAAALQSRCEAAAARELKRLTVELDTAARSRRAGDAYGRG